MAAAILCPATNAAEYRSEQIDFSYPDGWEVRVSRGTQATSIVVLPPGGRVELYIGVQDAPTIFDARSAHRGKVEQFAKGTSGVRVAEGPVTEDRPAGRGLTSVLIGPDPRDRQLVTSFAAPGLFALTAVPVPDGSVLLKAVREQILESLSFGLPGRLRLNRPDPEARPEALIGKWFSGTTRFRFSRSGEVKFEPVVYAPGSIRTGNYRVENGRIYIRWQPGGGYSGDEDDICVFRATATAMTRLCRNNPAEISYKRED